MQVPGYVVDSRIIKGDLFLIFSIIFLVALLTYFKFGFFDFVSGVGTHIIIYPFHLVTENY